MRKENQELLVKQFMAQNGTRRLTSEEKNQRKHLYNLTGNMDVFRGILAEEQGELMYPQLFCRLGITDVDLRRILRKTFGPLPIPQGALPEHPITRPRYDWISKESLDRILENGHRYIENKIIEGDYWPLYQVSDHLKMSQEYVRSMALTHTLLYVIHDKDMYFPSYQFDPKFSYFQLSELFEAFNTSSWGFMLNFLEYPVGNTAITPKDLIMRGHGDKVMKLAQTIANASA